MNYRRATLLTSHIAFCLWLLAPCQGLAVSTDVATIPSMAPYRGRVLQDEDCSEGIYNTYQDVIRDYREKAFSKTVSWETLRKTSDDVEVAVLKTDDDKICPYVRMRATIPASADKLYNFMSYRNWKTFMPLINPFYKGMTILNEYSFGEAKMILARKQSTRMFGFGKRDFSVVSVVDKPMSDGTLVSGTFSVVAPRKIPRYDGFTRAFQDIVCFHRSGDAAGQDQTELTIVLRTDLNDSSDGGTGGHFPMWLVVKTFGLAGAKAMQQLRRIARTEL